MIKYGNWNDLITEFAKQPKITLSSQITFLFNEVIRNKLLLLL